MVASPLYCGQVAGPPGHVLFFREPQTVTPSPRRRIAVVGLGMAVTPHAQSLRDLRDRVDVAGAFSPTRERRDAFAARFDVPVTGDLDALVSDPTITAALILTPPRTHLPLVTRFAEAGKHVLLEKPLEADTPRAEAVVDACERAGVALAVVLQHRFRPAARALAQCIAANRLGEIAAASVRVPWWRPQTYYDEPGRGTLARDGGGVLLTQAIHTLDFFLSVVPPLAEVSAFARTTPLHRMETEDIACAVLRFANGALGTLEATTASYPGFPERIEITGTRGTAILVGGKLDLYWHDGRHETAGEAGMQGGGADPMAFANDAHRAVLAEFLDALDAGRAPINSGRAALAVHDLIDAVLASSRTHAPVAVRQRP
jgi:UDP-N-acetyl-2-amino-2-deoxyglucuronate dehydrogenase